MNTLVSIAASAIVLILWFDIAVSQEVAVHKCNGIGKLEKVEVTGCDSLPCTFQRGEDYSINVTFIPSGHSSQLRFNATASFYGVKFPLMSGNACDILTDGQKCPVKDGVLYKINMATRLPVFAPPIRKLIVNATIVDEFNNIQACAALPARVV